MEIKTYAATSVDGRVLNQEVIMDFSGRMAGIWHMKGTFDDILREPEENTLRRSASTLEHKRHNVFGHQCVTLVLENLPKILALIFNNEGLYNVSEKSARHTELSSSGKESELYDKWKKIFVSEISLKYNDMDARMICELAQENARYMISVFTPLTTMAYTTSVQQLNYIVGWMEDFIEDAKNLPEDKVFCRRLSGVFSEFLGKIDRNLIIPGLTDPKGRSFSLFGKRKREDEWGENYSFSYFGSFAQLAEAQVHRTLHYEFMFPEFWDNTKRYPAFYIPRLLYDGKYEKEWLDDAKLVMPDFPQGMMLKINERGTCEDFILKCSERLCGQTQLEICAQTASTLHQYYWGTRNEKVRQYLDPYVDTPRCKIFGNLCKRPCYWGPAQAFTRLV